jgi:hypothetical protein
MLDQARLVTLQSVTKRKMFHVVAMIAVLVNRVRHRYIYQHDAVWPG